VTKPSLARLLLVALAVTAATPAAAQDSVAPPPDTAQPPATSANAELVGHLVNELSLSPTQAEGAAGAVFALAKKKLKPEEFGKVVAAVPGIEGLLKAAPAPDPKSAALDMIPGAGVASLASSLGKLGLKPEIALKLVPSMSAYLEGKGAGEAAALVGALLK
jgi:Protein of unknown function VcgC/VcgE (DUF2780)